MPRALAAVPDLDQELDRLYGLPLEEFTVARNDLAARLAKAGQTDAAEAVRGLKKPTVPVWTVNQLARRHAEDVATLLEAGDRLRRAQQEAFGGSGADKVREATSAERAAVRTLTRHAQALLRAEGRSASQHALERIAATLRSAAVEPDAARLLAAGRLAGELTPGFAAVAELAPPRRPRQRRAESVDAERERQAERRRLQARVDRLDRRAADEERRVARAEQTAAEARERAERARAEVDAARADLDELA